MVKDSMDLLELLRKSGDGDVDFLRELRVLMDAIMDAERIGATWLQRVRLWRSLAHHRKYRSLVE